MSTVVRHWNLAPKVYVNNLPEECRDKNELVEIFTRYGKVKDVWVMTDPPAFAFIEFEKEQDAAAAVRALDKGEAIPGKKLSVKGRLGLKPMRGRGRGDRHTGLTRDEMFAATNVPVGRADGANARSLRPSSQSETPSQEKRSRKSSRSDRSSLDRQRRQRDDMFERKDNSRRKSRDRESNSRENPNKIPLGRRSFSGRSLGARRSEEKRRSDQSRERHDDFSNIHSGSIKRSRREASLSPPPLHSRQDSRRKSSSKSVKRRGRQSDEEYRELKRGTIRSSKSDKKEKKLKKKSKAERKDREAEPDRKKKKKKSKHRREYEDDYLEENDLVYSRHPEESLRYPERPEEVYYERHRSHERSTRRPNLGYEHDDRFVARKSRGYSNEDYNDLYLDEPGPSHRERRRSRPFNMHPEYTEENYYLERRRPPHSHQQDPRNRYDRRT